MDQPAERLNRAIDRWRDWTLDEPLAHRPKLGALLAEGSGHAIYELISHNQKTLPIVARIRRQETRSGGDPLGQELAAWQFASREGLAPKCFYIDDAGVTICRRVSAPAQLVSAEALGTLCGRIPALSITLPRLDLRREIDKAAFMLRPESHPHFDDLQTLLKSLHDAKFLEDGLITPMGRMVPSIVGCEDEGLACM